MMKQTNKMKYIFILFFIFFCSSFIANAQTDKEMQQMELMMQIQLLKNALIAKDSIALSKLLSDDVSYGHTNGWVQTKSQLIRSVVSGEQDYADIESSNIDTRIYDLTGIVTMQSKVRMLFQKKPLDLNMKILLVWIKQSEDWKLVARQSVNYEQLNKQ